MTLAIVSLIFAAFLLIYEFWALLTGRKLITAHVREVYQAYPPFGFLIGLGTGLLFGHFFWCP